MSNHKGENCCGNPRGWDSTKIVQPKCDVADTIRVDCNSESHFGGIAFIPIVLKDVELQALVESKITLPTPAREIKNVRRNVSITECKAIPSVANPCELKVFVGGKIHKNIQYVEDCSGFVRDFSVNVPFNCNQAVKVDNCFWTVSEKFSFKSTLTGERIFIDKKGHAADPYQSGGLTFEFYNEPIECRLLFSLVNDLDIHKNFDKRGRFKVIIEKAEVVLVFKLLQSQQVFKFPHGTEHDHEHKRKKKDHETECDHDHESK